MHGRTGSSMDHTKEAKMSEEILEEDQVIEVEVVRPDGETVKRYLI